MKRAFSAMIVAWLIVLQMPLLAQTWEMEKSDETFTAPQGKSIDIVIDIDVGEVVLEPADSPNEIRVEMRYTEDEFKKDIRFDERRNHLKIQLDSKKWKKWRSYNTNDDAQAKVIISLPYDVEIFLTVKISAGDIDLELGGLTIKEFDFTNFAGEVRVAFSEPNKIVMDMLDISVKVGESNFISLGNARFKRADINSGIGETEVDFSGKLVQGSRAKVDLDIGEVTVILPENFGVRAHIGGGLSFLSSKNIDYGLRKRGSAYINDVYQSDETALLVKITPGLGELNVHME
ncbi:hypothetical protein KAR48_09400 [bacterium]|nr:hypothetical protein [bacterium]